MAKSIKLTNNLIPITHSELVALRNSGELYPGATYRITDYECSSSDTNTAVARNKFDILVKAIDTNKLSEHCGALRNASATYFPSVTNFDAWEVWYCLDNDATRFGWASSNGKGVIYRLIDEFGNDCPYDFKNIKFKRTVSWFSSHKDWCTSCLGGVPTSDHLYFTFSLIDDTDSDGRDLSTNYYGQKEFKFYQNKIAPHYNNIGIQQLNNILFILDNISRGSCYSNTFGNSCYSNTFGNDCYSNTFGNDCDSNTFGNDCDSNTFGNDCYSNTFGNDCVSNTFGNNCDSNTFGKSKTNRQNYCRYNCLEDGVQHILFYTSQTTSSTVFLQNITIHRGVKGSQNGALTINVTEVNKNYNREYGRNASGTLVNWVANA